MKKTLVTILIFSLTSVQAYSTENLIKFYKNFYQEELGIGFLVKKYNIHDPKLRRKILSYIKSNDLEVSNEEIEKSWTNYIQTNFNSPLELQKIIENNYHDLDQAKSNFIDDLDLDRYFDFIVRQRLIEDFELREKLSNEVITAKMTPREKLEAQKNLLAILKLDSLEELSSKYSLTKEDLDFLITTNFLLEKRSFSVYNLDLQKRILNLKANSSLTSDEAKKFIFSSYENRTQYLY